MRLRHGELEALAGNRVRSHAPTPDAAAHQPIVDQRDIGLRKFLIATLSGYSSRQIAAPRCAAGLAEIVERADVAAGREGALAGSLDHTR